MNKISITGQMIALIAAGAVAAIASSTFADPKAQFETSFGEQIRKVKRTSAKTDDVALAKNIADVARTLTDGETQVYFFEQAAAMAQSHPSGWTLALKCLDEAVDLQALVSAFGSESTVAEQRLDLLEKMYRRQDEAWDQQSIGERYLRAAMEAAGESERRGEFREAMAMYKKALPIAAKVDRALTTVLRESADRARMRAMTAMKLEQLIAQYEKPPNDPAIAKQITLMLLTELDQPGKALNYSDAAGDEELARVAQYAADEPGILTADELHFTAKWYDEKRKEATALFRPVLARRAGLYFRQFLLTAEKTDARRAEALAASTMLSPYADQEMTPFQFIRAVDELQARVNCRDCGADGKIVKKVRTGFRYAGSLKIPIYTEKTFTCTNCNGSGQEPKVDLTDVLDDFAAALMRTQGQNDASQKYANSTAAVLRERMGGPAIAARNKKSIDALAVEQALRLTPTLVVLYARLDADWNPADAASNMQRFSAAIDLPQFGFPKYAPVNVRSSRFPELAAGGQYLIAGVASPDFYNADPKTTIVDSAVVVPLDPAALSNTR